MPSDPPSDSRLRRSRAPPLILPLLWHCIGSKDLSIRPKNAVLNTLNLDMILQLKYMPIVMNPARIALSDWKS